MDSIKKRTISICVFFLGLISISTLFNARYISNGYSSYYYKQAIWFFGGFILLKYRNKYKTFLNNKWIFAINNLALLYTLFFGRSINGAKAWITLGSFSLQPSEFIKILLPLNYYNIINKSIPNYKKLLIGIIYFIVPSILVFLEPDTGAIIFYLIEFLIFLIFLKLNYKFYIITIIITLTMSGTLIYLYQNNLNFLIKVFGSSLFYRIDRMLNFKDNYQLKLSLTSFFSSPLINSNFKPASLYIPEFTTDFIFAYISRNYGILIAGFILIIYVIIFINIISLIDNNKKTNYLIISFLAIFFWQIIINVCMNIGLIPIIGINLPFLSYGGSNILMYFLFLSLII